LCCAALVAAWRLVAAVRRRRGQEIASRVMALTGVGILLYTLWIEMWRGEVPPAPRSTVDYLPFVAAGFFLLGDIISPGKPHSPGRR
jgi:hypothetical protein